jgi:hypothetical protein
MICDTTAVLSAAVATGEIARTRLILLSRSFMGLLIAEEERGAGAASLLC